MYIFNMVTGMDDITDVLAINIMNLQALSQKDLKDNNEASYSTAAIFSGFSCWC